MFKAKDPYNWQTAQRYYNPEDGRFYIEGDDGQFYPVQNQVAAEFQPYTYDAPQPRRRRRRRFF
ncbi:MAG: hypothetical protein ACYTGS_12185 [Planctomycetota bacterium]|jgi:hypothetical protein